MSAQNIDSISTFQVPRLFPDTVQQDVFGFEKIAATIQTDSVVSNLSVPEKPALGHFLQQTKVVFQLINHQDNISNWVTIFFLGLLLVLTLIWYFFPERVMRLLSREGSKHKLKYSDNQFAKPGLFLYSLYLITFISTTSALVLSVLNLWYPKALMKNSIPELVLSVSIAIVLYFLIKLLIIYLTGFIFNTEELASRQIKRNFRIDLIQSLLLIPVLIIYINISLTFILYAGLALFTIVTAYKWVLSIIIGLKSSKISLYHNILYLCALEIIPVIVLIKLMESYRIVF